MPKRQVQLYVNLGADRVVDALAPLQPCCPDWESMTEDQREQWRVDAAASFVQAMGVLTHMGYQVIGPPSTPPIAQLTRAVSQAQARRRLLAKREESFSGELDG